MIRISNLQFSYPGQRFALRLARLEIRPGEAVALTGPSGCGKSTLLRLCAGILRPSSGRIDLGDFIMPGGHEDRVREFRLREIGLVFQEFELLPYLNVAQNILAPLRLIPGAKTDKEALGRLSSLTSQTGLHPVLDHLPHELSGGEKQRTGICRALIHRPAFILADEPTSNLDSENQEQVLDLLLSHARDHHASVLVVSHAREALGRFDRVEHLPDLLDLAP